MWDAVKVAKNINKPKLPIEMTLNGVSINPSDLPDAFASFFENKVQLFVNDQTIDDSVHNGTRKMWTTDYHFMSIENIIKAVKTLKLKNCEGHDRIPQRILKDGIDILKYPLSILFNQIYLQKNYQNNGSLPKLPQYTKRQLT